MQKLHLIFSRETKRLTETRFGPAAPNDSAPTVFCYDASEAALNGTPAVLRWTAGLKGFCIAMLRAHGDGEERFTWESPGVSALWEAVRRCGDAGDSFWLASIFGGGGHVRQYLLHSGGSSTAVVSLVRDWAKKLRLQVDLRDNSGHIQRDISQNECSRLAVSLEEDLQARAKQPEEPEPTELISRVSLLAKRKGQDFLPVENLLPLQAGDFIRVRARFSEPVHALFLWLDSQGRYQPLHPNVIELSQVIDRTCRGINYV